MRNYGGLWNKVVNFGNMFYAARLAAKGARRTFEVQSFLYNLEPELLRLKHELETGSYLPGRYRTFLVHDPKERLISAAPFRDRVVHHAVCDVLEPVLGRIFTENSYACRKGKGTHIAIEKAQQLLRGNKYYLKCDIMKFFNSVDHCVLKETLSERFREHKLLSLVYRIIDNPVSGCGHGKGLAIGNLTSQHFANLLLTKLDLFVLHELKPGGYVRYMDDFVLFDNSLGSLHGHHFEIESYLNSKMHLYMKSGVTFTAPARHGLPFLGMQIFRSIKRVHGKSLRRLQKKLKQRTSEWNTDRIDYERYERSLNSIFGHLANADSLLLRGDICNDMRISGE